MTVAAKRNFIPGYAFTEPTGNQRQVLAQRKIHPGLLALGIGRFERKLFARCREFPDVFTGNFTQKFPSCCEVAFGCDLISNGLIISGLRFLHVGDGDQADLEALFGLFELTGDGLPVSVPGDEHIFRGQHAEITLSNANDQVLLRRFANRFGPGHDFIGTTQVDDLIPAKHRLTQVHAPASRIRLSFDRARDYVDGRRKLFDARALEI